MPATHERPRTPPTALPTDPRWTASNRDWRRRDQLLGITTDDDPDDVTHFHGLDLPRLEALVREGFAPLGCRQNRAPTTEGFLGFMRDWPEVHAFGYAVHPAREDYRITLEGVACAIERVPEGRRAALAEAFRARFREADEFVDAVGCLYAWWD